MRSYRSHWLQGGLPAHLHHPYHTGCSPLHHTHSQLEAHQAMTTEKAYVASTQSGDNAVYIVMRAKNRVHQCVNSL